MPKFLHELVSLQAAARPESIAVRWKDDSIPYGEFDRLTNQLAHTLRGHGCKFGDRVALLIPNSANAVIATVGILKAGCVVVPIDIDTAAAQVADLLNDCRPTLLLATRLARSLIDQLCFFDFASFSVGTLEALPIEGECFVTKFTGLEILDAAPEVPVCGATTRAPAWIFYQRGDVACDVSDPSARPVFEAQISTPHRPTVVSHAECLNFLSERQCYPLTEFDRVSGLPMHSPLTAAESFAAFAAGAELHVVPREVLTRPRQLADFVRTHQITEWLTNHGSLSEGILSGEIREGDLPALRHLLWSGRTLLPNVFRELKQYLPLTHFAQIVGDASGKFGGHFSPVSTASEFELILAEAPLPALATA